MTAYYPFIIILLSLSISGTSYAKRDKRNGFNFGVSLRLLDTEDKSLAGNETVKNSEIQTEVQSVRPYFGVVIFDAFNVGLSGLFENQKTQEQLVSTEDERSISRTSQSILKSYNLFSRFMFAKFMYFEGGFGLYDRTTKVENEFTSDKGDGIFVGEREEYRVRGVGFGYHLGGGLEIPVTNGFYFTANYLVRTFQLRDQSKDTIGKKRARVQKRELTFGLSHYVK